MNDFSKKRRVVPSDLSTRALRALVPTALALGIIALYPPISESVVARFGAGFRPQLVAIYVGTLVGLFLLDAWGRDRRLSRIRERAARAEREAELQNQRVEELRFVLDVAGELNGRDRIESSLFRVLERLRGEIDFTTGHVFVRDVDQGNLARRGIFPLIASPSTRSMKLAEQTVDLEAYDNKNPVCIFGPADRPDAVACAIRFQDDVIGVLVLEKPRALREHDQARLLALADRLGASLNGVRLLAAVEGRERVLRHAYQELRLSGRRLAQTAAREQAARIGRAAAQAMHGPVDSALIEVRRLRRMVPPEHRTSAFKECVERIDEQLKELTLCGDELRTCSQTPSNATEILVNEVVVAAVDLVLPDLKRSGIDIRMMLDRDLPAANVDEGAFVSLVTRVLQRERALLRRSCAPRLIMMETRPYGDGVKLILRDNSAGIGIGIDTHTPRIIAPNGSLTDVSSPLAEALRADKRELPGDELDRDTGIRVEFEEELGSGRSWTISLRGAGVERSHSASLL